MTVSSPLAPQHNPLPASGKRSRGLLPLRRGDGQSEGKPPPARPLWALLTGPYALFLVFVLLIPFANVALLSVRAYSPTSIALPEFTLANYGKIFDLYHLRLFARTLQLGLLTTLICALFGYPFAYALARARLRMQTLGLFLLIMPLMVSAVIRIFGWIVILGRKGLINQALLGLGLEPVKLLYSETAVVIGLVNIFMPFMVLPLMAAIERIPPSLEEAARNLGASWLAMFVRIILPLSLPGLISGCLLVYSISISAFVTPALMGSPRERMAAQQIYDEVLVSFNWPSASSLALTLVLLTLALMFAALFITRRAGRLERSR
jgi:putative spermidine/putrescine transport system permease protein